MSANLRAYLILGAIFLLGIATGAGVMYAYGHHGAAHPAEGARGRAHVERRVAALTEQLHLSTDQATKIAAILEHQREPRSKLMRETMDRCGEPLRKLRAASDTEIRALLSPEQQRQFDELLQSRAAQNKQTP